MRIGFKEFEKATTKILEIYRKKCRNLHCSIQKKKKELIFSNFYIHHIFPFFFLVTSFTDHDVNRWASIMYAIVLRVCSDVNFHSDTIRTFFFFLLLPCSEQKTLPSTGSTYVIHHFNVRDSSDHQNDEV